MSKLHENDRALTRPLLAERAIAPIHARITGTRSIESALQAPQNIGALHLRHDGEEVGFYRPAQRSNGDTPAYTARRRRCL